MPTGPTDIQVAYNMMGNMKIITNLDQPDPCVAIEEAIP